MCLRTMVCESNPTLGYSTTSNTYGWRIEPSCIVHCNVLGREGKGVLGKTQLQVWPLSYQCTQTLIWLNQTSLKQYT